MRKDSSVPRPLTPPPAHLHVQHRLVDLRQLAGDDLQAALQQRAPGAHAAVRRQHAQRQDVELRGALRAAAAAQSGAAQRRNA